MSIDVGNRVSAADTDDMRRPIATIRRHLGIFVALLLTASGCAATRPPLQGSATESGTASWYGGRFHGRRTASGEIFDASRLTAAHRSLPFGTRVRVTNLENGRRVVVRVNDRGPWRSGRIIDLSREAARSLGFLARGTVSVRLQVLEPGTATAGVRDR